MSAIATIVTTILLPVLFWAAYHYYKDRHRPEPILKLVICLGLGALSTVLAHWAYAGLGYFNLRFDAIALGERSTLGLFAYAVLAIGVIEETAKFIPFFFVALRFKEFDERVDGIVYASFIALGFAAFENLRYLEFVSTTEALARGFSSPIVHIMFASIWGYWVGHAHLEKSKIWPVVLLSLTAAAVAHGIYDFAVLGLPVWALPISALIILSVWLWRMRLIVRLHKRE